MGPADQDEPSAETPHPERRRATAPLLAALIASAAVVIAIAITDYLPTHDGPHHLFQGYLTHHFDDPGTLYDRYFEPGHPITALGFVLPFGALEALGGWRFAYAATLSLIALVWGWGAFALFGAVHRERRWLGLIGFGCALGWSLFMGLFGYTLSMGLCFAVTALALRLAPWRWIEVAGLALALTITSIAHVFGGLATGLVLIALALAGAVGPRRRAIPQLAVAGLPVIALVFMLRGAPTTQGEDTWLSLSDQLVLAGRLTVGGPTWRWLPILALACAGIGSAVVTLIRTPSRLSPVDRGLFGAALIAWLFALVTPLHLVHWQFFSPRFLPLATMISIALLPVERMPTPPQGRRRAIAVLVSLFTLGSIAWAGGFNRAIRERIDPALAALDERVPGLGPRMTVVLDPFAGLAGGWGYGAEHWTGVALPYYAPLFNLGPLYAVGRGGVPAHLFSDNPLVLSYVKSAEGRKRFPPTFSLDSLRDRGVMQSPERRADLITWLALLGRHYDEVLLYAAPTDAATLRARGYQPIVEEAGEAHLLLARFEGCRIEVAFEATERADVFVEIGHGPNVALRRRLGSDQLASPLTVPDTLCGASWLWAVIDRDGSGTPSPSDIPCGQADAQGRIAFDNDEVTRLRCRFDPQGGR